jgi:catechol 2,3-dioxygenase-like lactoylglutathione lyase family enzyme
MSDSRVEFLRFHHVSIAVPDLDAAVADWTERLGWTPSTTSGSATFPLEDSYLELIAAGGADGPAPGVVSVSVVVDDVDAVAERVTAAGAKVSRDADGNLVFDAAGLNGVPLELRAEDASSATPSLSAFRRINHVVVAVADDDTAQAWWTKVFGAWPPHAQAGPAAAEGATEVAEVIHHVPVGIAWFGLTAAGTNADALTRFIERRGEGVYALALVVNDYPEAIGALEQRGARMIGSLGDSQTFIHPATTHGILIDVVPERHPSRVG